MRVFTVGHSTRSLDEFLGLLSAYHITLLVDIRVAPGSRRYPHFARDALAASLPAAGIAYLHLKDLGGWRRPRADSPHTGWRSEGFRAYADHMETAPFAAALGQVIAQARRHTVVLMCAEALPWRCHRQLVADALLTRGVEVVHILDRTHSEPHRMTPFARIEGKRLIYDGRPRLVDREHPSTEEALHGVVGGPGTQSSGTRRSGGRPGPDAQRQYPAGAQSSGTSGKAECRGRRRHR